MLLYASDQIYFPSNNQLKKNTMANARLIFLLLFILPLAMGDQENIPTSTYMNHLRLSAAVLNQSFPNNFLSHKNFDLESLFYDAEGNNYLEYLSPTQLARKHSRVSFPTKKIYEFSSIDICGMTRSNVSLECCSNLQYMFTAAAKKQSWAWQSKYTF